MASGKRSFSAPQAVAMILVIVALILIVYTALTRGEPMLYALGAMDLGLAAILWKVRKKKPD